MSNYWRRPRVDPVPLQRAGEWVRGEWKPSSSPQPGYFVQPQAPRTKEPFLRGLALGLALGALITVVIIIVLAGVAP